MENFNSPPKDVNPNDLMREMDGAVQDGSLQGLEAVLARGIDVNQTDWEGRTALQMMCAKGKKEAVEFLLSKGADVNKVFMYQGRMPKTALDAARETNRKEIEEILVSHGAKAASEL